ncbi:hypothetical protein PG459_005012 [Salmonella enterica]|nr:hypothetical protein [Salmonella enterica]
MQNATTPGPVTLTVTPELAGAEFTVAPNPIVTSTSPGNGSTGPINLFNHYNIRVAQAGGAKTPWGGAVAVGVNIIDPTGHAVNNNSDVYASPNVIIAADNQGANAQFNAASADRYEHYANTDKQGVTYIDTVIGVSLKTDISYRAQGSNYTLENLQMETQVSRGRDLETGTTPQRVCTGPVREYAVVPALKGLRVLMSSAAKTGFQFVDTCGADPKDELSSNVNAASFGGTMGDLSNVATPAYLVLRQYKPT